MSRPGGGPTVWVLVGDLSLTGVPVVLHRYLRGVGAAAAAGVHVVARHSGALEPAVRDVAAGLTVLEPAGGRSPTDVVALALDAAGAGAAASGLRRRRLAHRVRGLPRADVVLVHGAGGLSLLDELDVRAPVVVHLHELATGLSRSGPAGSVGRRLRGAAAVMAVSAPVAGLARDLGVAAGSLSVVPGVVDPDGPADPAAARAALGETGPVVAGAGAPGHRKGTDRVVALAHELARGNGARVVWVGGRPSGADATWVGAPDPVRWVAATPRPWDLLAGVDVVVVPSREDPLPLVALEAGQHGRPVVATSTGGLPGLVGDGRGVVVGTHDLPALVAGVRSLLERPEEAAALGAALRRHVEEHHSVGAVSGRWWEVLCAVAGR